MLHTLTLDAGGCPYFIDASTYYDADFDNFDNADVDFDDHFDTNDDDFADILILIILI